MPPKPSDAETSKSLKKQKSCENIKETHSPRFSNEWPKQIGNVTTQVPIGLMNAIYRVPFRVSPWVGAAIHLCPSWVLRPPELCQSKGLPCRPSSSGAHRWSGCFTAMLIHLLQV